LHAYKQKQTYIAYTLYPVEGIFILFRNSAIGRVESPPANRSLL